MKKYMKILCVCLVIIMIILIFKNNNKDKKVNIKSNYKLQKIEKDKLEKENNNLIQNNKDKYIENMKIVFNELNKNRMNNVYEFKNINEIIYELKENGVISENEEFEICISNYVEDVEKNLKDTTSEIIDFYDIDGKKVYEKVPIYDNKEIELENYLSEMKQQKYYLIKYKDIKSNNCFYFISKYNNGFKDFNFYLMSINDYIVYDR